MIGFALSVGLISNIVFCQDSLSTDYPFLYKVKANCLVSYDGNNQMYYYNYELFNDAINHGNISDFLVDISRQNNSVLYDTIGLRFDSDYEKNAFFEDYPPRSGRVIAVGFPVLPWPWTATLANRPVAWFGTNTLEPKPGETVDSLVMMSKALPGIRAFEDMPYFNIYEFFPNIEDTTSHMTIEQMDSIREAVNYYGWTIGPSAPPINFIPTVWCDTLTSYTTQSRSLGWIKDDATENKYLGYFTSIKTKYLQQDNVGARTVLLQVFKDVDIDSTANLTSEAYALICYNTKYLLAQLPILIVQLVNSTGSLLTTGTLQYNDSIWEDATNNNDGTFTIVTNRNKLSLRMTYAGGTQTKSNVTIKNDTTIIFQTKNVSVNLQTSQGTPLDTGIVQYNAGGWQNFGTTSNGVITKELLPVNYNFRITYNGATVTKSQSIDSNATVVFQTVPAFVQLQTSTGAQLDTGIVEYNSGGWRSFGTTMNGNTTKELLPIKYNFRITYDGATISKSQSIDSNKTIIFQTVKTLVQFNNSKGNAIDTGIVQFNSGGWQSFGSTFNGVVSKELLPVKYIFRLTYNGSSVNIAQNVDSSATISISTVLCTVSVTNSSGNPLNNATVSYNAGGWNVIGTTVNGIVAKEFLPVKIQFRAAYGSKQQSVTQDVSINPLVAITLPVQ